MVPVVSTSAVVSPTAGTADLNAPAQAPRGLRAVPGVSRRLARRRSDHVLAARFAAGDDGAFAILYERHRASVLAVCIGVLGSRHDAEDAAQESFAKLAVALRRAPPDELGAWLARVARNAAIDIARHRRSSTTIDEATQAIEVAPHERDGIDALESVMAGIRELPESQRTALLMRELAGHSYAEIAGLLDVDEDAVRGLIARARVGLRAHREAVQMPCASVRAALAAEPDGRRHDRVVRRHLRSCRACKAWQRALRSDAHVLRGLVPAPAGGLLGGGAIAGGIAAKGALLSGAAAQVTAACAVSVCAVGGIALLYPHPSHRIQHQHAHHATHAPLRSATGAAAGEVAGSTVSASAEQIGGSAVAIGVSAVAKDLLSGGGQPAVPGHPPANPSAHGRPGGQGQTGSGSGSDSGSGDSGAFAGGGSGRDGSSGSSGSSGSPSGTDGSSSSNLPGMPGGQDGGGTATTPAGASGNGAAPTAQPDSSASHDAHSPSTDTPNAPSGGDGHGTVPPSSDLQPESPPMAPLGTATITVPVTPTKPGD